MQTEKINLDETDCFSSFFIDYIDGKEKLVSFYQESPNIENFSNQISNRTFSASRRQALVNLLNEQYKGLAPTSAVSENINSLLSEKTFTVTTGHQMNIFTGPLYFIYKIVTVINAAKSLKAKYPAYHFVPIYWMASEDHDFDEINHFHLHDKKFQWTTEQTGAVGKFDPSELKEIISLLPGDVSVFEKAYLENTSLADACRDYVDALFGKEGLVVIDADDQGLKKEFIPVIENDLFEHSSNTLVTEQTKQLEKLGYKTQVTPREINFFYMHEGIRARIEKSKEGFEVVDTDLKFSVDEIKALIQDHPERFSPNVVLRPLYQEMILPNLGYIGGPSELVYWLQLKTVFEHFSTPFPLLMPRNFGLVIPSHQKKKWDKTGFGIDDLFLPSNELENLWISRHSKADLSYSEAANSISDLYGSLENKAEAIDITLVQHIKALSKQAINKIETAEKKLVRAEKRKQKEALQQIHDVKEVLFPNAGLQERYDNLLKFSQKDPEFISTLLEALDPFDFKMHVLIEPPK